jgi:hypothetical protein
MQAPLVTVTTTHWVRKRALLLWRDLHVWLLVWVGKLLAAWVMPHLEAP